MIIGKNIVRNDTVFCYRSIKKRGEKTRYKKNVDSLHGIGWLIWTWILSIVFFCLQYSSSFVQYIYLGFYIVL